MESNVVCIAGEIISDFEFSHQFNEKKFYKCKIKITRNSGAADVIPVMTPGHLIDPKTDYTGIRAIIVGSYHSRKVFSGGRMRLELFVFAKDVIWANTADENLVLLKGVISKSPIFRKTPKGRSITDIMLIVKREGGKTDYIPCVAWGENAMLASQLDVGTEVRIEGRIQSREYQKRLSESCSILKMAYEVSISQMEVTESEEHKNQVADAE